MSHEKRNGIESFWSMLKRGYQAIFHKISPERLNRHVSEFAGRHSIRVLDTVDMMLRMVAGIVKRLRYLELIGW
ncbi:MAG: hypothetical protein TE42_00725 [Candidatus Synechococcus spongiarum SP3]|uniref:ISXO2-like transposase domain-containing protein n=1 Tax=Candidatus Synechococcus spongiarum SP3 TaxID=1604020 RepID=A0A0G2IX37_9SYNE|nr:MAG: hypothetical protein TE42_00725 [Candidatus Synechococcus spongiarum SP3]